MLGLKLPTDPRWVNLADKAIEDILTDHAYCEQKAASTGISLIQQYPEIEELVEKLSPVVAEEWGHFRMVLDELKKRGLKLGRQRKDEYVGRLQIFCRKDGNKEERLVDKLLFAALIEARSCERFKLLSQGVSDAALRQFYKNLMVSEAGHYKMFLDLACSILPKEGVMQRWSEWLEFEAGIMGQLEARGDRMH
jgi:tRNA-(ms[2]io[6]A)-hydroxylase